MTEEPRRCGAKTRSGNPCKAYSLGRNGRCKMHGGTNPGPPLGNKNAVKHGIYSEVMEAEDRAVYDRIETGSLDEEIRMTRVRLRRALQQQVFYDAAKSSGASVTELRDKLELSEIVTVSINGEAAQTSVKRVLRDFRREINTLTRTIADLEMKAMTLGTANPGNADEIAHKIREALRQIDAANGVSAPETENPK